MAMCRQSQYQNGLSVGWGVTGKNDDFALTETGSDSRSYFVFQIEVTSKISHDDTTGHKNGDINKFFQSTHRKSLRSKEHCLQIGRKRLRAPEGKDDVFAIYIYYHFLARQFLLNSILQLTS